MIDALNGITKKLETLRSLDPECQRFGVHTHRYRLDKPISESALNNSTGRYHIQLPKDFSEFVTKIGNGGAGPGYGLQRSGFVDSVSAIPTATPHGPMRVVQKTSNCTLSRQELFDAAGRKVDPMDVDYFEPLKYFTPDGQLGTKGPSQHFSLNASFRNGENSEHDWEEINPNLGTWMLSDYGCGITAHLVLNGEFFGQVWLCDPNAEFYVPFSEVAYFHYTDSTETTEADAKTNFTFVVWYEHWLDHAIEQCRNDENA